MDYFQLKYGLMADAHDLLEKVPALIRLSKEYPSYVRRACVIQKTVRKYAMS